jgi:hypothetical protein
VARWRATVVAGAPRLESERGAHLRGWRHHHPER